MRLHRYKAANRRLRLMVNRYPRKLPCGLAVQRGMTVWSLVWNGPAARRRYRCCDHPKPHHHPRCPVVSLDPHPLVIDGPRGGDDGS